MNHGRLGYLTLSVNVNKFPHCCSITLDRSWDQAGLFQALACTVACIFSSLVLSGCMAPLAALGSGSTAAASSVGSSAVTAAAAYPITTASVVTTVSTGKSPLEHAASAATKKECHFFNAFSGEPICSEVQMPTVVDHSQPYLGPADAVQSSSQ